MKTKQFIKLSSMFAIPMAIIFMISDGVLMGLIKGVLCGALFGFSMLAFTRIPAIKRQTKLRSQDLLPGEKIVTGELSNFVIRIDHVGLKRFAFDQLLWTVGMKNKEALGGKIYLTNYRLVFKSHQLNRLRGMVSIFLPTVLEISDNSNLIGDKIQIKTKYSNIELVVNDSKETISKIKNQIDNLNANDIQKIQQSAIEYPQKVSDGLTKWNSLNTLNNFILIAQKAEESTKLITNPIGALGSMFLSEFLDQTISEEWEKILNKSN